jgi:hypothetical protein
MGKQARKRNKLDDLTENDESRRPKVFEKQRAPSRYIYYE